MPDLVMLSEKPKSTKTSKSAKAFSRHRKYRNRRRGFGLVLLTSLLAVAAWFGVAWLDVTAAPSEGLEPSRERPTLDVTPTADPVAAPDPPDLTLASFAYNDVADELPESTPEVLYAQQSVEDDSWATVRFPAPEKDGMERYYALYLRKDGDDWVTRKSVLVEDQAYPRNVRTLLPDVPEDLINPSFPPDDAPNPSSDPEERAEQALNIATGEDSWQAAKTETEGDFHRVTVGTGDSQANETDVYLREESGGLSVAAIGTDTTSAEVPGFPGRLAQESFLASPKSAAFDRPVPEYTGGARSERVEKGMEQALTEVQAYPGVVGFYAVDLESGDGYGIRPDEQFFSASTIKIAVMAAVYEKIEAGDLEYSDAFDTVEEDFAAGAGWLQWETPGAPTTVEDALWLMMTESDNVATNALTRLVGGPEYVNRVARDLGAEDTNLYWKVSSERGAVPSLDNSTTPRDMAAMMQSIHESESVSDYSRGEMIGLMEQNNLEYWMEGGVPQGVKVANKGGWIDATFNDVGIVEYEDRPYALATFTKYGPNMAEGQKTLAAVSEAVWLSQSGMTKEDYENQQKDRQDDAGQSRDTQKDEDRGSSGGTQKSPEG